MAYEFRPPTYDQSVSINGHRDFLWDRIKFKVGVTVVKTTSGTYRQERVHRSDADDIAIVYPGGHVSLVDDEEAAALTSAGYGSFLTPVS